MQPSKGGASLNSLAQAKAALARARFLPPSSQKSLQHKVHKKFPGIGKAHAMAQALKVGIL